MWNIMMMGHKPFSVSKEGALELTLKPVVPGAWFDEQGLVSFTFLGQATVT